LSVIALGFSSNLTWWAIISGIRGFISTINGAFVTTFVLDQVPEVKEAMIGREFLLGAGRTIGTLVLFASLFRFNSPKIALIIIGCVYLFFPLLIYRKKLYQKDLR